MAIGNGVAMRGKVIVMGCATATGRDVINARGYVPSVRVNVANIRAAPIIK